MGVMGGVGWGGEALRMGTNKILVPMDAEIILIAVLISWVQICVKMY